MSNKIMSRIVMRAITTMIILFHQLKVGRTAPAKENIHRLQHEKYLRRNPLANLTISCTEQEKMCFKENMLWFPGAGGACFPLFRRGPCPPGRWLVADKRTALRPAGHVLAACEPHVRRACPPRRVPMAADGGCVVDVLACSGASIVLDIFGEGGCKVSDADKGEIPLPGVLPDGRCSTLLVAALNVFNPSTKLNCVQDNSGKCQKEAVVKYEVFFDDYDN